MPNNTSLFGYPILLIVYWGYMDFECVAGVRPTINSEYILFL